MSIRCLMSLCCTVLLLATGCGRLAYKPNQQAAAAAEQQMQLVAQQSQEYQSRAQSLDRDNQELETILAQSRQKVQLLTDEINTTRDQLRTTTDQLLAMREDNSQLRTKTSALMASVNQREQGEIRANNSMMKNLASGDLPGVQVRQDGDLLRVEIPADQLFMPGSPYLKEGAQQLLTSVANDLRQNFPEHIIGIEGHTDDTATHSQQYPSNHHLSAAQALSVYNALIERGSLPAVQLFVIGHGGNHAVVSNATDAGKARNRRIEFVVYPERIASR
ncbi:OmpA/MotB family protein [Bythopirellula polymerisocia]|nr:OmpA family protein [Bythopirellula polymerisocia]